ncbi:hypothetical protein ACEZDB_19590 [Streptacidiphilus sp. N1-3]|uniref:Pyridoxamine 5'-phosphate oxidase n=1 Tax=Streptacidiphilus alkalitolerans TaxID=3342712 RepID=A0ABV6X3I2_9ACTN
MTELSAELLDRTLAEESAKKSGLLWVRIADTTDRPLWQVWHDGAVLVVGEGAEQPLHGLADGQQTVLTARSKDKGGRLVSWPVRVEQLEPGSEAWTAAAEELKGKRLNSPDHETVTERWARESRLLRLVPTGGPVSGPDALPTGSHAATPVPTPATTRQPAPAALPRLLFGRRRKRK